MKKTQREEKTNEYTCFAPFDQGLAQLHNKGLELITARELAEIHSIKPPHTYLFPISWIAESFVYLSNGNILVTTREQNPILQFPQEATQQHSEESEFYLSDRVLKDIFERAQTDVDQALITGVLLLKKETLPEKIPFEQFSQQPLTRFLFRELAAEYGQFRSKFSHKPYASIHVFRPNSQLFPLPHRSLTPFARDIRIGNSSILGSSDIDGIGYEGGGGMGGTYFQLAQHNYMTGIRLRNTEAIP